MERLTMKQRKFVNEVAQTGNGTQAALKVYDTDDYMTAANIASENLNKPKIINAIQEALPDELLAQVHLEGLNAFRSVTQGEGDVDEYPDYAVRHKYLDSAYKLKGLYAADKHININVEVGVREELKELAHGLLDSQRQ